MARQPKAKVAEPAASPSSPSVRFTALEVAMITAPANRAQPTLPRSMGMVPFRVKDSMVLTLTQRTASTAKALATTSCPVSLARLLRPVLCWRLTLIQSSVSPTRPAPTMVRMMSTPERVKTTPGPRWAAV